MIVKEKICEFLLKLHILVGTPSGVRTLDTLVETIVEIQTFSDDKSLKLKSQINSEKFSYSYLNCDKVATKWRHFMQKKDGPNIIYSIVTVSLDLNLSSKNKKQPERLPRLLSRVRLCHLFTPPLVHVSTSIISF